MTMNIRFAADALLNRWKQSLLSVLLFVVCTSLVVFSAVIHTGLNYSYSAVDDVLKRGIQNTAVLRLSDNNADFLNELSSLPEVEAIGSSYKFGIGSIPQLYEIQRPYKKEDDGVLEAVCVNQGATDLCDLNLKSGDTPDSLNYADENGKVVEYLYLGDLYESIPVGTVFDTKKIIYKVAGILDDSQRWIDESLLNGVDINTFDYTFDCSSTIISVSGNLPFTSDIWISAADGYALEQVIAKALDLSSDYDLEVQYRTLQSAFDTANADTAVMRTILSRLMVVVIFCSVVMMICFQMIQILSDKREMGIRLAVGFSSFDIWVTVFLKNLIISLASLVLSVPICLLILKWWFSTAQAGKIVYSVVMSSALPAAVITVFAILAVLSVITFCILKKMRPLDMIGRAT